MEGAAWTNERLDDLAKSMRSGFARMDQDIRDLRSEMHTGFGQVRTEINELRTEFRVVMFRAGTGIVLALIGVIAAILARGV
jgi:hypothetical protein